MMPRTNSFPATESEGISVQLRLRSRCDFRSTIDTKGIRNICGADAAYGPGRVFGAMVCVSYPDGKILNRAVEDVPLTFPYIPGLFAFRELPVLKITYQSLGAYPDLLIAEGHGYAHPRRFGLASHLGVVLDVPTIGVAKNPLVGKVQEPGQERGSVSEIMDGGEVIGMAVRTKHGARPVYVSKGYRTDLDLALEVVLTLTGDNRMPSPLVYADRLSRTARTEWSEGRELRDL